MTIEIRFQEASETVEYSNVKTTYTKGPLFCILYNTGRVQKLPLMHIFDVQHPYDEQEDAR